MIRIGLDIATNTGYCVISKSPTSTKIELIGVEKLWYKGNYFESAKKCRWLVEKILKYTNIESCVEDICFCIELSKYGNNTTYIFSMLTGLIIQAINNYLMEHKLMYRGVRVKLIDPNTWHKELGFIKNGDMKIQSIDQANTTIQQDRVIAPYTIKDDNEADAFNLAYYGHNINDIFVVKEVQLGKKKQKMSLQRALSTLYKKEHDWVRKLDDAWQDENTFHTNKTFKRVKKCENKIREIQEQIAKLNEVK